MELMPNQQTNPENHPSGAVISGLLFIWDFLKIVLIALVIIIPIRYFIFQPFVVFGSSMEPNFYNGQYLIIDEVSYRFSDPARGHSIVLKYPNNPKEYYIKRIVAMPGETVQIENGRVTIYNTQNPNGVTLDEPYLPNQGLTYAHNASIVAGDRTLTLKEDEYFVMGDNRFASSDSRDWGPLERSEIVGKVFLRLLPVKHLEVYTGTPAYNF